MGDDNEKIPFTKRRGLHPSGPKSDAEEVELPVALLKTFGAIANGPPGVATEVLDLLSRKLTGHEAQGTVSVPARLAAPILGFLNSGGMLDNLTEAVGAPEDLDTFKSADDAAWEEHPWLYGLGRALGFGGMMIGPGGAELAVVGTGGKLATRTAAAQAGKVPLWLARIAGTYGEGVTTAVLSAVADAKSIEEAEAAAKSMLGNGWVHAFSGAGAAAGEIGYTVGSKVKELARRAERYMKVVRFGHDPDAIQRALQEGVPADKIVPGMPRDATYDDVMDNLAKRSESVHRETSVFATAGDDSAQLANEARRRGRVAQNLEQKAAAAAEEAPEVARRRAQAQKLRETQRALPERVRRDDEALADLRREALGEKGDVVDELSQMPLEGKAPTPRSTEVAPPKDPGYEYQIDRALEKGSDTGLLKGAVVKDADGGTSQMPSRDLLDEQAEWAEGALDTFEKRHPTHAEFDGDVEAPTLASEPPARVRKQEYDAEREAEKAAAEQRMDDAKNMLQRYLAGEDVDAPREPPGGGLPPNVKASRDAARGPDNRFPEGHRGPRDKGKGARGRRQRRKVLEAREEELDDLLTEIDDSVFESQGGNRWAVPDDVDWPADQARTIEYKRPSNQEAADLLAEEAGRQADDIERQVVGKEKRAAGLATEAVRRREDANLYARAAGASPEVAPGVTGMHSKNEAVINTSGGSLSPTARVHTRMPASTQQHLYELTGDVGGFLGAAVQKLARTGIRGGASYTGQQHRPPAPQAPADLKIGKTQTPEKMQEVRRQADTLRGREALNKIEDPEVRAWASEVLGDETMRVNGRRLSREEAIKFLVDRRNKQGMNNER